jgi:hypothetical protein
MFPIFVSVTNLENPSFKYDGWGVKNLLLYMYVLCCVVFWFHASGKYAKLIFFILDMYVCLQVH